MREGLYLRSFPSCKVLCIVHSEVLEVYLTARFYGDAYTAAAPPVDDLIFELYLPVCPLLPHIPLAAALVAGDVGRLHIRLLEPGRPQDQPIIEKLYLVQADNPDSPPEEAPPVLHPGLPLI